MKAVFYFSAIGIKNIAVRTVGQFFLLIVSKRLTWFVVNQKCSGLCVDQRVIPTSTQPPIMSVSIDARRSECASSLHEPEFRALPKNLEATNELRKVVEDAIERIPAGKPFLVRD
jgi:hypothetical protein